MRFLTNTFNPENKNAPGRAARRLDETVAEAWANHVAWLADKVIGDPQATDTVTVAQLKEMGYVGVYATEKP